LNDLTKQTLRDTFGRVGEWLYDHAAETLAFLVAATAGAAFGLWLHIGNLSQQIDDIAELQASDRLCQRISGCGAFTEVASLAGSCEKDQLLCHDRLATISARVLEVERRLNSLYDYRQKPGSP
jgi:hypothetical protein